MALPQENATKTACEHGHPLAGENLLLVNRSDGRRERVCRACSRARYRRWRRLHYVPHPRQRKPPPPPKPPREPRPLLDRLLAKVDQGEGCWEWLGATTNGYGVIQRGGRGQGLVKVHRAMYEAFVAPVPSGLDVMHACHNRACVNPGHLIVGTRAENMRMSQEAGRLKRKHG